MTKEDAISIWKKLKKAGQLSQEDSVRDAPLGANEDVGKHLRIAGVISGRDMAVILGKNVETLKEGPFKDEIANLTSIHAQRLVVFKDDGALLEEVAKTKKSQK